MWVTILFIGERDDPARFARLIQVLNFCIVRDKTKSFKYEVQQGGEGIRIYSPTRDQAYKRGSYFKKKFEIGYQVVFEK